MITGRIAIIDYIGNIITSTKFIGNVSPVDVEKKFTNFFEDIRSPEGFMSVAMDFSFVYDKNKNEQLINQVSGEWYNTRYNYENNWNCDYVYIKNLSKETKYFVTPDGFVALPYGETLIFYYGKPLKQNESLMNINVGDIVKIADVEWIVLKKNSYSVFCITKDIISTMKFSLNSQNYKESEIRTRLQNFAQTLKGKIGEDYLIPKIIDLTTNEGKQYFRRVTDDIGLLTEDEYKEFESVIKKYPVNNWWWLATAYPRYNYTICCVYDDGTLNFNGCGSNLGVRPTCLFSAEIFK